jgi:hypothetical protein
MPEPGDPFVSLEEAIDIAPASCAHALSYAAVPWPAAPPSTVRIRTDDLAIAVATMDDWLDHIIGNTGPVRPALARLRAALENPS